MANSAILLQGNGNVSSATDSIAQNSGSVQTSLQSQQSTSSSAKTSVADMQVIRRSLESKSIYGKSADIILSSWRTGTQKQYTTHINKWLKSCGEKQVDPLYPSIADIISFLTGLYEQDLSYSSLNTAQSALSSMITIDSMALGSHPIVARFLKGVYNLRPPMPRYKQMILWDVSVVLQYLKTLHPLRSLTLKDLTHKLVMLISITTAQRLQTWRYRNQQWCSLLINL